MHYLTERRVIKDGEVDIFLGYLYRKVYIVGIHNFDDNARVLFGEVLAGRRAMQRGNSVDIHEYTQFSVSLDRIEVTWFCVIFDFLNRAFSCQLRVKRVAVRVRQQ